ncbi:MAG TPA: MoxR family ATPase [Candidatus Saccharimonadales bacterium]|nr:MoxR family ATPase [Candidatus Saccharimonadales bacterium]
MTSDAVESLRKELLAHRYVADRGLSMALHLGLTLHRPILIEGEAGVGKTEVAKVLAEILDAPLIRLQCYEGIDVNQAVYEWNYARQMLHIRAAEHAEDTTGDLARQVFGPEFLIRRPLLQAIESTDGRAPVLLIDEIDRADEEFEAFLLELLSDYQVTIPELGTMRATVPPVVVLTSNRTREIHDALKRRCLYYWIEYPSLEKELAIIVARLPDAPENLARQVCAAVQMLRALDLQKVPGIAETLDWTAALYSLGQSELDEGLARETLCAILKMQEDIDAVQPRLSELVARARIA